MAFRITFPSVALITVLIFSASLEAENLELVQERPESENFSLVDLNGKVHRLSDYRGSVVLVSFWATWCPQCIWEMPSLQSLSKKLGKESFVILAVNVGEKQLTVRDFVNKHAVIFTVLLDDSLATYRKWPVLGLPTSFIIDPDGKVAYTVVGAIEWIDPETLSTIEKLLP